RVMNIETTRLILRPWMEEDREPFAAMSADPAVMEHLLPLGDRDRANAWIDRQMAHLAEHGFCFWALEEKESGAFAGSVGLVKVGYEAHFTPAVEVGWRLARAFWGRGYAPEAAIASMGYGFEVFGLSEIVANTAICSVERLMRLRRGA
ncbi:GNAT family N-acetyltransferase, partial [Roseomonas mucosa]